MSASVYRTITCPRCGFLFEVAPSGNDPGTARVDFEAFRGTCRLLSEVVTDPLHCPELRRIWYGPEGDTSGEEVVAEDRVAVSLRPRTG